jgi:heme o synthase
MESKILKKLSDYLQLIKLRLTLFVVFSAAMAYLWTTNKHVDTLIIWLLSIGGFFITACANILNQLIEQKTDCLMRRTKNRPLAAARMNNSEAIALAVIFGIIGSTCLFMINNISFLLGLLAIATYVLVYTLLKKQTVFAIVPGAIAGSLPILIGSTAANGYIGTEAILLFGIQFIWQFPHTWSIAWLLNDDYKNAGIKMLPTESKPDRTALIILFSAFLTIPSGLLMFMYGFASIHIVWLIGIVGLILTLFAYQLFQNQTNKSAMKVMFSSFIYLPFVLLALIIDKIL